MLYRIRSCLNFSGRFGRDPIVGWLRWLVSIVDVKVRYRDFRVRSTCQFVYFSLCILAFVVLVSDDILICGGQEPFVGEKLSRCATVCQLSF